MSDWPFSPPLSPMKAQVREQIPVGDWAYEPKWDGFRMLAWSGPEVRLDSRNGRPLLRYLPELTPALERLPAGTVVDGEVVVVIDDRVSFDALGNRIHPAASRVAMLAEQTPAALVAFDLLAHEGDDLRQQPFSERRRRLEGLVAGLGLPWNLSPLTTDPDEAGRWFVEYESAGCDGLVCKRLDQRYVEEKREMVKVKHRRTVDVVIGGYREHKDGGKVGSLLLGMYAPNGQLHFVGHTSGFSEKDRKAIFEQLQPLVGGASFGADVRVPGAESRWSGGKDLSWVPLRNDLVAEVSFDQLAEGRFRHAARFERWRIDKPPEECTLDQIDPPTGAGFDDVVGG